METYKLDKLVVQPYLQLLVELVQLLQNIDLQIVNKVHNDLNHLLNLQPVFVMLQDQQQIAVP
jgi:hypothetical protein